jgi:hypothetical protein
MEGLGSVQIITEYGYDPRGPKTFGSHGHGSGPWFGPINYFCSIFILQYFYYFYFCVVSEAAATCTCVGNLSPAMRARNQWWANLDQAPEDLDKNIFRDLSPTPIP